MHLRLLLLFVAATFTGCALTKDTIDIKYTPNSAQAIPGASGRSVKVLVADSRATKGWVSRKKNGYGMEMAPIETREPVSTIVARALEAELSARGFRIGSGGTTAQANVLRFYSNWEVGFWTSTAAAEVTLEMAVRGSGYRKTVTGQERNSGEMAMGGGGAQEGLELALRDAIRQLMDDPAFVRSLLGRESD